MSPVIFSLFPVNFKVLEQCQITESRHRGGKKNQEVTTTSLDKQHLFCSYQQQHKHKSHQLRSTGNLQTLQSGHANQAESWICELARTLLDSPRPISESTLLMLFHQHGQRTIWTGSDDLFLFYSFFFLNFLFVLFSMPVMVHSREEDTSMKKVSYMSWLQCHILGNSN